MPKSPGALTELQRLHEEYAVATKRAADALRANDGQHRRNTLENLGGLGRLPVGPGWSSIL
jgi:hypothetical protein